MGPRITGLLRVLSLTLGLVFLAACGTPSAPPTSVTVTPAQATMAIGDSQQFTATTTYADGTTVAEGNQNPLAA